MSENPIVAGLDPAQRAAVEATRGPLCILAGAGTGKTTTITRRIANQVGTGAFEAGQILAVTFTDKAAGELRARLQALGVSGVRARTFHSAAAAQLRALASDEPGAILPSKVLALRSLASSLPKPYRFRPAADLATEIERAKNRRVAAEGYLDSLGTHQPPIPPELMAGIFTRYERGKRDRGLLDFEDLLERTIQLFDDDPYALERFQARYAAFTVDEYQDVNLLQQSLLERWLGERDDLCVVGDDYQSIYGFTGASPSYLIEMPARVARTTTVRLETNYRSTPDVLAVANLLARTLEGPAKVLRAATPPGARPVLEERASPADELDFVVARVRELHEAGVAFSDIAILYRVNYRSEDYEEALAAARIPFAVRDGGILERAAARRLLAPLRNRTWTGVAAGVRAAAERAGWSEELPDGLGEAELTRQRDLGRLVALAQELDDGRLTAAAFVEAVEARFGSAEGATGVNLLTLHRAKGLEFDAVFIPRLQDGELPFRRAVRDGDIEEERRLLYVGITRARRHLTITWCRGARRPSRFLDDLLGSRPRSAAGRTQVGGDEAAVDALKAWRRRRARSDGVPAYVVLHDRTLEAVAARRPRTLVQLGMVDGIGPTRLERYGREILEELGEAR
jgi:DNA helicase-2/ATP-dependent DNA helicase PcrA